MIEIGNNFISKYASAVRKARTEKIRVVRLEPDLYYAARREEGHGRYLIRFFHQGDSINAVCSSIYNLPCESTKKPSQCCVHIAAATLRAIKHGFRLAKKEAA